MAYSVGIHPEVLPIMNETCLIVNRSTTGANLLIGDTPGQLAAFGTVLAPGGSINYDLTRPRWIAATAAATPYDILPGAVGYNAAPSPSTPAAASGLIFSSNIPPSPSTTINVSIGALDRFLVFKNTGVYSLGGDPCWLSVTGNDSGIEYATCLYCGLVSGTIFPIYPAQTTDFCAVLPELDRSVVVTVHSQNAFGVNSLQVWGVQEQPILGRLPVETFTGQVNNATVAIGLTGGGNKAFRIMGVGYSMSGGALANAYVTLIVPPFSNPNANLQLLGTIGGAAGTQSDGFLSMPSPQPIVGWAGTLINMTCSAAVYLDVSLQVQRLN